MFRELRRLHPAVLIALAMWIISAPALAAEDVLTPSEVVDAFNSAIDRGDAKAAASHLLRDVMIFEMGSADRSRRDYEAYHLKIDIEFASTTTRTLKSRRQGVDGGLHWVVSLYHDQGTHNGKPVDEATAETVLLRLVAGHWRIAHLHWSSADVTAAGPGGK